MSANSMATREALRFVPITPYLFRTTASDYAVAKGTVMKHCWRTGSHVLPVTLSAMFDERAFDSRTVHANAQLV